LQTELASEFVHLLQALAQTKHGDKSCVITTDPDLWIERTLGGSIDILDISPALGPPPERELSSFVVRQFELAGWPVNSIVREYRLASKFGVTVDIALLGDRNRPIAFVEIVSRYHSMEPTIDKVQRNSRLGDARFSIVTNGKDILLIDSATGKTTERSTFPTPSELGYPEMKSETLSEMLGVQNEEEWGINVESFSKPELLLNTLNAKRTEILIIDHTIPIVRLPSSPLIPSELSIRNVWYTSVLLAAAVSVPSLRVIVAVVPRSFCFDGHERQIRKYVSKHLNLSAIVETATKFPSINLSILRLSAKVPETVALVSVTASELIDVRNQPWLKDLEKALTGSSETTYVVRRKISPEQAWTMAQFQDQTKMILERLKALGTVVNLGDVCDIIPGLRHSREESGSHGIPFLRGRDLGKAPLDLQDLSRFSAPNIPPQTKILNGDVLLQRIGTQPHIMVADAGLEGSVASDTIFILRMKQGFDPFALSEFLQSPEGQKLLLATLPGAAGPTLSRSALRSLSVLVLPDHVTNTLREMDTVEKDMIEKAQRLRSLRLGLLSSPSSEVLTERIEEMRQKSKMLAASLKEAESFDFQIRNFFPYPIAFEYRSLKSINDLRELYKEQLRFAENIMAFICSVTLALIEPADRKESRIDPKAIWQGGISPGTWRETAMRGAAFLCKYKDHPLASSVARVWTRSSGLAKPLSELITAKNDFKHDRGPRIDEDYVSAVEKVGSLLDQCTRQLAFFRVSDPTDLRCQSRSWKSRCHSSDIQMRWGSSCSTARDLGIS
jgi:hypothetical protein